MGKTFIFILYDKTACVCRLIIKLKRKKSNTNSILRLSVLDFHFGGRVFWIEIDVKEITWDKTHSTRSNYRVHGDLMFKSVIIIRSAVIASHSLLVRRP